MFTTPRAHLTNGVTVFLGPVTCGDGLRLTVEVAMDSPVSLSAGDELTNEISVTEAITTLTDFRTDLQGVIRGDTVEATFYGNAMTAGVTGEDFFITVDTEKICLDTDVENPLTKDDIVELESTINEVIYVLKSGLWS